MYEKWGKQLNTGIMQNFTHTPLCTKDRDGQVLWSPLNHMKTEKAATSVRKGFNEKGEDWLTYRKEVTFRHTHFSFPKR